MAMTPEAKVKKKVVDTPEDVRGLLLLSGYRGIR